MGRGAGGRAATLGRTDRGGRDASRSFPCGLMNGAFLGIYLVLVYVNLVISWVLSQLTNSRTIIGLAPTS